MTERGVQPEMAQPANQSWQQRWKARYTIRRAYPPFRQALLWIRDIGLVLDATLCIGIALWAPPTVLTDHPALQAYVAFMSNYFGAIHRLSVGALYPEVSQLVFAVGWGVAIVPFVAALLNSAIYSLVLDYRNTKAEMARSYEDRIVRSGRLVELITIPIVTLILASMVLGDLGVISPSLGWVNGIGMTKAQDSIHPHSFVNAFLLHLYTSRFGLGIVAFTIIGVATVLYSSAWLILVFKGPIWLRRRLKAGRPG